MKIRKIISTGKQTGSKDTHRAVFAAERRWVYSMFTNELLSKKCNEDWNIITIYLLYLSHQTSRATHMPCHVLLYPRNIFLHPTPYRASTPVWMLNINIKWNNRANHPGFDVDMYCNNRSDQYHHLINIISRKNRLRDTILNANVRQNRDGYQNIASLLYALFGRFREVTWRSIDIG